MDMLQARGYFRHGRCCLCRTNVEIVDHLFGDCLFFSSVWKIFMDTLHLSISWEPTGLMDNVHRWNDSFPSLMDTPLATIWKIWHAQNLDIFQDYFLRTYSVCIKILTKLKDFGCGSSPSTIISTQPLICDRPLVTCFFYGA